MTDEPRGASTWSHNTAYHPWILDHARTVGGRALDVGCGDGLLLTRLSPVCTQVTGLDSDPGAVDRAAARNADRANVTVCRGGFLEADLPAGGFDLVTFVASLHHLELAAALHRAATLLAPGGRLLVVGLSRNASPADWVVGGLSLPLVQLLDRLHGLGGGDGGVVLADPQDSYGAIRRSAAAIVPGARLRRALYYRYLLAWTRP